MNIEQFIQDYKEKDSKIIQEYLTNLDKDDILKLELTTNKEIDYWNITNAIKLLRFKGDIKLVLRFIDQTIDKVNDPYWLGYITKQLNDIVEILKNNDF